MQRPTGLLVIGALALVEGLLGIVLALAWLNRGVEMFSRGGPFAFLVGVLATGRGVLVAIGPVLLLVFAWGALTGKSWARPVGLLAGTVTIALIAALSLGGAPLLLIVGWAVVPVVIVLYFFTPGGRGALPR